MMHPTIFDTSAILNKCGVRHVVICPGSRNAPLTISFVRNEAMIRHSVVDERSAGFIAMGIAQRSKQPVAVICTSGSAILNLAPACAEAFYQEVPVLFISADRPPEWTDQGDGQTIRQPNVLEPHVKKSYQFPVDLTHPDAQWEYRRKLCESVNEATHGIKGPVHLNIPFREPFYPDADQELKFSKNLQVTRLIDGDHLLPNSVRATLQQEWKQFERKVIVLGQGLPGKDLLARIREIGQQQHIPIIADVISNASSLPNIITQQDLFMAHPKAIEELRPDLVITIGKTLISKNLKIALRMGSAHWHVGQNRPTDTFKNLTRIYGCDPASFIQGISAEKSQGEAYFQQWNTAEANTATRVRQALKGAPWSEFTFFQKLLSMIPAGSHVHLANSMIVRYANFFTPRQKEITFHCNRGTSGIDGATSTAVGHAVAGNERHLLITGDLSALYDRNAFLNDLNLSDFKVIVSNNGGGGIFDLIPGPKVLQDQERQKYFETRHSFGFRDLAKEVGLSYHQLDSEAGIDDTLRNFLQRSENALLEVKTRAEINGKVFRKVKQSLKEESPFEDS